MQRIDVGVLGATGMVGQQFIAQLANHPWFRLTWVGASERSAGQAYRNAAPWRLPVSIPVDVADLVVQEARPGAGNPPELLFSAMDASVAGEIEEAFAKAGHFVVSNARNHRMAPDVPLLVPEINSDHLGLIDAQRKARGWTGALVTNPNCSTVVLSMALAPLRQFGLKSVAVTTLQALSGAGYPGVASLDAVGNVVPFISGEEAKIESEPKKILGHLEGGVVVPHPVVLSASTTRVPVVNGHTESVVGGARAVAVAGRCAAGAGELQRPAAGAEAAVGASAARAVSLRGEPAAAAARRRSRRRHDRDGRTPASVPDSRLQVLRARPQHRARRGGRGRAERRADGRAGRAVGAGARVTP